MKGGYGYNEEGEFETAIAAAAFSVKSLEDQIVEPYSSNNNNRKKYSTSYGGEQVPISRANTRILEDANYTPPQSNGSISRRSSYKDYLNVGRATERSRTFSTRLKSDTKADAWERSAMAKIGKWYEKLNSDTIAWEKNKALKAKVDVEKKKSKLELKRELNLQHYQNKIARISHIAEGARMQMEEKRKFEESMVKERKKRMRSKEKDRFSWFYFSC